ncbi:hypothetical protein QWJ07_14600 [Frankia sp. RB7]|nr:hypothetical protein [Frankia sp. RB7]
MPINLMRASAEPATPVSRARNGNVVAIVLTAALVTLQLAGLVMLERSHAHAMQVSFPREPASCADSAAVPVSQILYD